MARRGRLLAGIIALAATAASSCGKARMAGDGGSGAGGGAGVGAAGGEGGGGVGGGATGGAAAALENTPCRIIAPVAWQVAFATDAPRAFATGVAAHVLDTDAWALRRSFAAHDGIVLWGAIAPDGTRGTTIGNDGVLRVWRTDDGVEIARTAVTTGASLGQTIGVFGALSRGGVVAVVDAQTGAVQVLDPGTLAVRWTGSAPAPVASLMFTPEGGTLIAGTTDRFVRFDASNGTPLPPIMVPGSDGRGTLSGDGRVLATTGPMDHVQTLRYPDGAPTMSPVSTSTRGIALSRDGSMLAVGLLSGVRLVQTSDGATIRTLQGPDYYQSIAFSGDDTLVGGTGSTLTVWRRSDGNVMFNSGSNLGGATLSPTRPVLATGHANRLMVVIWDYEQGQLLRTFNDAAPYSYNILGFSDAGRLSLGVQGLTWRGLLYDLGQPQPLSSVTYTFASQAPDWAAGGLSLTGDERFLVGVGDAEHIGRVRIWDTASGTLVRTLPGHEAGIWTLALDGRNKRIATGGYEAGEKAGVSIKLWDQESGALLRSFVGHTDMVVQLAFSPDGTQLLSGGRDGLVRLWSVADGAVVRDFAGPADRITNTVWYGMGVSFSPSGGLVASGGSDSGVRDGATVVNIWSTATGSLVRHLEVRGDLQTGYGATWSADGRAIIGTGPGGLYVWCLGELDSAASSP